MVRFTRIILSIAFVIAFHSRMAYGQTVTYTSPFIIKCLAIDGNELWIGAMGGLTKVDLLTGNNTVYTCSNTPMQANDIDAIFIDKDGNKWISCGDYGRGFYKFDGIKWTEYYLNIQNVKYSSPTSIHQDPLNRIAALCPDNSGLLMVIDSSGVTSISLSQLPGINNRAKDFDIDSLGHFWFATHEGIIYYDSTNWTVYYPQFNFEKIKLDKKGAVWATRKDNPVNEIFKFDGISWIIDSSTNAQMAGMGNILIDKNNNKLFYSYYHPVLVFNDTIWSNFSGNWCTGNPGPLLIDSAGGIYSAQSYKDSVNFLLNSVCTSLSCSDFAYTDNYFSTVDFGPDNKIYAATNQGLYQFNGISKSKIPTPSTNKYFRKLRFDHSGMLWLISYDSQVGNYHLARWDGISWTVYPYTYDFEDMDIAPNGDIWFGTRNGILKYDGINFTNIPFTSPTTTYPMVYSLTIDTNGNVWFGVNGSFAKYDGNNFTWYDSSNTPFNIGDTYIRADKKGNVFMNNGSWNSPGGLVKYDGSNFILYNSSNSNWPDSCFFYSLWDDNLGNTWFGTNRGLIKYDGLNFNWIENISNGMGSYPTYDLAIDNIGNVWCANEFNLSVLNPYDNGQFEIEPKFKVSGTEFLDLNNNGIFDSTETGVPYHKVFLNPGNVCQLTNYQGKYTLYTDSGQCEVSYNPVPNYNLTTDSTLFHVSADSVFNCCFDFGINPQSVVHDANLDLFSYRIRCNQPGNVYLNITNNGTVSDDFKIWLKCDSNISYFSANIQPYLISGDTVYWNINNLPPFGISQLNVLVTLSNSQIQPGTLFNISAGIDDLTSNVNYATDNSTILLTCSMDPNDKTVEPLGDSIYHAVPVTDWLEYTIHFQNIGNDTAISVFIYDTLDLHLDLNTFTFISSSHHPVVKYDGNGNVRFAFYNIMLPDSHVNNLASEGFIRYKVKPKTSTPDSTRIENIAHIYFDFNNPVRTNTVFNTILNPSTGIFLPQQTLDVINVYPNPLFQNELHIDFNFYPVNKPEVSISDLSGRKIQSAILARSKLHTLTLPELDEGIYAVSIIDGNNHYNKKLVIIKP